MQPIINLNGLYGLPLCVTGITPRLTLSKEMADHDLRRKAMKKQRSQNIGFFHTNQEMGIERNHHQRVYEEIKEDEIMNQLHDLQNNCLSCSAKAA